MHVKYTNAYTILRDILKNEYTLILSIMVVNIMDIVHVLKSDSKHPLYGEVLEYLYLSMPRYYTSTHDKICEKFKYVDNVIRTLYNIIVSDGYNQFAKEEFKRLKEELQDRADIDIQ